MHEQSIGSFQRFAHVTTIHIPLQLDETKLDDKQKAELKAFRESYNLPEVLNFDGTTNVRTPSPLTSTLSAAG